MKCKTGRFFFYRIFMSDLKFPGHVETYVQMHAGYRVCARTGLHVACTGRDLTKVANSPN